MSIDSQNGMHWALLGLYKHIDVLKWFRDVGEKRFPSIALLARIHLGRMVDVLKDNFCFGTTGTSW
ncbi:hypothetical protein F444_08064 [Phytophthora nicotianae P1976]|uniref:HAT C-terminal dimerisation domain-containing protein n=1 Tax=Phytophthora nicotianae P1976 TaxID=1317066 RepID=A0A081ACE1_PHYNI|nr:hypothetical protein F444_08064 [Phytophthora nicotianae P1976]